MEGSRHREVSGGSGRPTGGPVPESCRSTGLGVQRPRCCAPMELCVVGTSILFWASVFQTDFRDVSVRTDCKWTENKDF